MDAIASSLRRISLPLPYSYQAVSFKYNKHFIKISGYSREDQHWEFILLIGKNGNRSEYFNASLIS